MEDMLYSQLCVYTLVYTISKVSLINPRRACARVTVVVLCVCLFVCLSVPALAASASVETSNQRYPLVSLRLFLDFDSWISKKTSVQKLWREKANMQMS